MEQFDWQREEHEFHRQFHIVEHDEDFLTPRAFLGTTIEGRGFYHITSMNIGNDRETRLDCTLQRASGHLVSFQGEDEVQPQGQSISQICPLFSCFILKITFLSNFISGVGSYVLTYKPEYYKLFFLPLYHVLGVLKVCRVVEESV